MSSLHDQKTLMTLSKTASREVQNRVIVLVLGGMLTVALVFGLTFYFALVSNQSAVARQVPELAAVATRLKTFLVMNMLVFVAVVMGSFYALSRLITSRMFRPLAILHEDLLKVAAGELPRSQAAAEEGPFARFEQALRAALAGLRERELAEVEELERIAEAISAQGTMQYAARKLEDLAERKKALAGTTAPRPESREGENREDAVFMQEL